MPIALHAQAVSTWTRESPDNDQLPSPVRDVPAQVVKHPRVHPRAVPSDAQTRVLVGDPASPTLGNPMLHSHHLLVSPKQQRLNDPQTAKHPLHHSMRNLKYHRPIQPPAATLPESNTRATWKTPYSYGHFGGSGTRHWTVHHGYRDRMIEWRLR